MATWTEIDMLSEAGISLLVEYEDLKIVDVDVDGKGSIRFIKENEITDRLEFKYWKGKRGVLEVL